MKLSQKQNKELNILLWFCGEALIWPEDIKKFFDYSDRGIGKDDALKALLAPKEFNPGFVALMTAKRNRDLQIAQYKEHWGDTVNAWSFLDEPQFVVEWIAEKLDRETIVQAWHEHRYKWYKPWTRKHKTIAQRYQEIIDNKPFNKPMSITRS